MNENDEIQIIGVLSKGYGIMPKMVALDEKLSIESKAIYAFLTSFSGAGQGAFPSVETILHYLKISEKRYYKYRKELIENGYITVKPRYLENKRISNIYILNMDKVVPSQIESVQNESVQNESVQNESVQNDGNNINNNNINNNNINKDSILLSLYEKLGFGTINDISKTDLEVLANEYTETWVSEAMKEANSQGVRNLKYVTGILKNWKTKGFKSEKKKYVKSTCQNRNKPKSLKCNNFEPREYDYDSLEKRLLGWDKD